VEQADQVVLVVQAVQLVLAVLAVQEVLADLADLVVQADLAAVAAAVVAADTPTVKVLLRILVLVVAVAQVFLAVLEEHLLEL
jgi:hypothetical protein